MGSVRADGEEGLVRGLLSGIAALRWAALAWMAALVVVQRADLVRPAPAVALVALAGALTVGLTVLSRRHPALALHPVTVAAELTVGASLLAADASVYDPERSLTLGSAWPLAGVLAAGLAAGSWGGVTAGLALGGAQALGERLGDGDASVISLVSSAVLFVLAGAVAGFVTARLRSAERQISAARAREEVARTLHDGVLQTLAVVQRRSPDPELASLARDQERELRDYLLGLRPDGADADLGSRLRGAAARFERRFDARVTVVVAPDLVEPVPEVADALAGAVAEALTNAGKHGRASRVTIYAESDDDGRGCVFCSVKDDGCGFEPSSLLEGTGLRRSIRGRLEEVGGRVELAGAPGRGAEVRLWAPAGPLSRPGGRPLRRGRSPRSTA